LTVTLNLAFPADRLDARWYIDGEFVQGQGVSAEGSGFAAGESVTFPMERYEKSGIADGTEAIVELDVKVMGRGYDQDTVRIPLTVMYGETYEYNISETRQTPAGRLDEEMPMPIESAPDELDLAPGVDWENVDPKIRDVIYQDTFGTGHRIRLLSVGARDESKFTSEEWDIIMLAIEQGLVYWEE
jgi:hypothetical protein